MAIQLPTLDNLDVSGKVVLLRADLNVPMEGGRVTDDTRIKRLCPTITELVKKNAKVVILSHFGRPEGRYVPGMSLAPLVDHLSAMCGKDVKFGVDCIGAAARETIESLEPGGIALLENLRFHVEEEAGDDAFAKQMAELGDLYVNDAFSCSHRAHASITGIPKYLPYAAGRLLQHEVETLDALFSNAERPVAAIVGGAKVSTKLALLEHLITRVDTLIIGGAMANTFLHARGIPIGKSLYESKLVSKAAEILNLATARNCKLLLPVDAAVSETLAPNASGQVVDIQSVPKDSMIIDVGPDTVAAYSEALKSCKTAVWNGPVGAFETAPFDNGTVSVARVLAKLTGQGKLKSVAGGGDTLSALSHAGVSDCLTYLSTAGGAFLEWLEGKTLPGIAALTADSNKKVLSA